MARKKKAETAEGAGEKKAGGVLANAKVIRARLTLLEPMLGTKSANKQLFSDYIAAKRPAGIAADEMDAAQRKKAELERMNAEADKLELAKTCFHRTEEGVPMIWDYQVKGFFKDACKGLRSVAGSESSELKSYKVVIDKLIFVDERKIPLVLPKGTEVADVERPLRAQTMQGERVALAKSESVPAGTQMDITIRMLDPRHEGVVREWLDYGRLSGLGQWRNSGVGRFKWEELEAEG